MTCSNYYISVSVCTYMHVYMLVPVIILATDIQLKQYESYKVYH